MRNRRRRLYPETSGSGGDWNPPKPKRLPRTLECREAREIIDALAPNREDQLALDEHLATCAECTLAQQVEASFRAVIAPRERLAPSMQFESKLMLSLGLVPPGERAVFANEVKQPRWVWTIPLVGLGVLTAAQLMIFFNALDSLRSPFLSLFAWLAAHLNGNSAAFVGRLSPSYLEHHMFMVNLILAAIVTAAGAVAVQSSLRE